MSRREIETILKQVEQLLATAGTLPAEAEEAVEKLLNVVESLCSHNQTLSDEVKRLRQEQEKKKKPKTTGQQNQGDGKKPKDDSNHSSEKRRNRAKKNRPAHDRRTFKDLTIHDTIECPVDPSTLPPDAVRMPDESKVVQRVAGEFWHTHILCNPFYAAYFTRPQKDRLTVLEVLQNTSDLRFRFGKEALSLLQAEFDLPKKWQQALVGLGEVECGKTALALILQGWFGNGNRQVRTAIEQAAAIVYYRHQESVPVVETIVCDDAGQFKLLTEKLALCWIHAGRHYEKLSPVAPRHAELLESFITRYWEYYRCLQSYRTVPSEQQAASLRLEFDELFSTRTGYTALDDRIAKTEAKKDELLTVLSVPSVPLHNNGSELQARVSARRRDVSLHSRSVRGARAMDIFTTLVQTAKLHGISAYTYFRDRISRRFELPSLATVIRNAGLATVNETAIGHVVQL